MIADECLANVDEKMRVRIIMSIKSMFPDRLFVYISHNVIEVASFCNEIWVLRGPDKAEQAIMVMGQGSFDPKPVDHEALQQTMLEIVNAA